MLKFQVRKGETEENILGGLKFNLFFLLHALLFLLKNQRTKTWREVFSNCARSIQCNEIYSCMSYSCKFGIERNKNPDFLVIKRPQVCSVLCVPHPSDFYPQFPGIFQSVVYFASRQPHPPWTWTTQLFCLFLNLPLSSFHSTSIF